MTDRDKGTLEKSSLGPEKPKVHTRWLDGSKFVDPKELVRSESFRRTVEAIRKIETRTSQ